MTAAAGIPVFVLLTPVSADERLTEFLAARGRVVGPLVRGVGFLSATGIAADRLNRWWATHLPGETTAVFLAYDEPGLEEWIPGSDGLWVVSVETPPRAQVLSRAAAGSVFPLVGQDLDTLARYASHVLGLATGMVPSDASILGEARSLAYAPAIAPTQSPAAAGRGAGALDGPSTAVEEPPARTRYGSWDSLGRGLRSAVGRLRPSARMARGAGDLSALGSAVNANRPIVVGFASRKGGVGKTTYAAAVAATVGEALDGFADTAALVDGNITNPDSWSLHPPPDATTVRRLVGCLTSGAEPPPEIYARTPRLAIYPESRDSEEPYAPAEIDVVVEYLRRRHAFIAVDLPNALPSLTSGGPGAVAAAWLTHCDVVVLPFGADPRARQGLLEYLDAVGDDTGQPGRPIVAPFLSPSTHEVVEDPGVLADIGAARRLGARVVAVPDDDHALLALLREIPVHRASAGLRRAYVELTREVIEAAITARAR